MTIDQVWTQIREVRPISRRHVCRWISALHIKPLGARQRPQQYPSDTAQQILAHLGLAEQAEQPRSERIVSMGQLRKEKTKANRRAK